MQTQKEKGQQAPPVDGRTGCRHRHGSNFSWPYVWTTYHVLPSDHNSSHTVHVQNTCIPVPRHPKSYPIMVSGLKVASASDPIANQAPCHGCPLTWRPGNVAVAQTPRVHWWNTRDNHSLSRSQRRDAEGTWRLLVHSNSEVQPASCSYYSLIMVLIHCSQFILALSPVTHSFQQEMVCGCSCLTGFLRLLACRKLDVLSKGGSIHERESVNLSFLLDVMFAVFLVFIWIRKLCSSPSVRFFVIVMSGFWSSSNAVFVSTEIII